jgi:hypothetical protein
VDAGVVREFALFLAQEKKWWLGPLLGVFGVLSVAIVAAEGSAFAPFVYSIF